MKKIKHFSVFAGAVLFAAPGYLGAVAAPISHRPIVPIRTNDGRVARGPHNSFESSNWSGYVLSEYTTGQSQSYTSAAGAWVVPSVAQPASGKAGYSSSWVGIGGFCLNSLCTHVDHSLIQLGTEADVNTSGVATYYAWYEMLPNPETPIATSSFAVNPGDKIVATLALQPAAANIKNTKGGKSGGNHGGNGGNKSGGGTSSGSVWLLTLTNQNTQDTWSVTTTYKSSYASAEWVQEAPSAAGTLPLADFGTATFDPETVNSGANPGFTDADSVVMLNPNGQTSNISSPDIETDGFNACWGSGSAFTTPCDAPQS